MVACFDELAPRFAASHPSIVDKEVIPPFTGEPGDNWIHLICERADDVAAAKEREPVFREWLTGCLASRGYPANSLPSLKLSFTSLEDIEAGGGRFYYFR